MSLSEDVESYRSIVEALKSCDVQLTSNWVEQASKKLVADKKSVPTKEEWNTIYRENVEAISKADIVVAEKGSLT